MPLGSTLAVDSIRAERTIPPRAGGIRRPRRLTPRLLAVRDLIAAGLSNKDIAARLRLSDRTAKVYVCDLYRVTGETRNRIIAGARQFYQDAAEGLPRMGAFE